MTDVIKALWQQGIVAESGVLGRQYVHWPECAKSAKTPRNRRAKKLTVDINEDYALWICINCGWSGRTNAIKCFCTFQSLLVAAKHLERPADCLVGRFAFPHCPALHLSLVDADFSPHRRWSVC